MQRVDYLHDEFPKTNNYNKEEISINSTSRTMVPTFSAAITTPTRSLISSETSRYYVPGDKIYVIIMSTLLD